MSLKTQAFPLANRLTEKGCFTRVLSKPAYTQKSHFLSVFAGLGNTAQARLGIVVAKRNVKLAVARNRLKRLVRESFRKQQGLLGGLDIVVVIKKNFVLEQKDTVNLAQVLKVVGDKHVAKTGGFSNTLL